MEMSSLGDPSRPDPAGWEYLEPTPGADSQNGRECSQCTETSSPPRLLSTNV